VVQSKEKGNSDYHCQLITGTGAPLGERKGEGKGKEGKGKDEDECKGNGKEKGKVRMKENGKRRLPLLGEGWSRAKKMEKVTTIAS
jgi:hypothetical protein